MDKWYLCIPIGLLILVGAFFSAAEIAFSSANMVRLKNRKTGNGSVSHLIAMKILDNYKILIIAII